MDHDAGRSTSSSANVYSLSISTCSLSFQAFQSIQQLYAALVKHALKTTGTQIKYNSLIGLISRPELLSVLPRALVLPSFRQDCTGVLSNFLRSHDNVEIYASLFCNFDFDHARCVIFGGQPAPSSDPALPSTTAIGPPHDLKASPSRGEPDDHDWNPRFGRLSMRTSAEIEAAAPSDEEVHEAMELLHTRFGDPPFLKRFSDLRVMVKTFDRCPDYSCLSRLLLPLEAEDLVEIAAAVSEEIPTPRWNASQRSTVIAALARVCAALFRACAICAEAPRSTSGAAADESTPEGEVSSTPAPKPAAVTSSFATPVTVSLPPPLDGLSPLATSQHATTLHGTCSCFVRVTGAAFPRPTHCV